ncbi:MAG: hypothetical protein E7672_00335 [Ruminococcaceae bacterium]|nr:hypothetical protein [Oscillospiraceae bacterium]
MLDTIFLQIFDMTKVASLVILIVLLVRLCLKRAPKVISYALWAVVLFRLLCPVSIEAPISVIPHTEPTIETYDLLNEPITPIAAIDAAQQAVGDVLNGGIGTQHVYTTNYLEDGTRRIISTDWNTVWILFTKFVWLGGMAALLIYSTVSLIRLKRRLIGAILLRDNIYLADHIDSPFVMGLIRPMIYLPSSLSEKERDYIILHEQHHIRRGDHIVKLLSFIALCLHCFNPLVWVAFILSSKDMEMSCDEAVIRKLGDGIRADYSASLISLATGRRIIAGTPLAFGEGNTEGRIKNIARWKKPALWVILAAILVTVVVIVCLVTDPAQKNTSLMGADYRVEEVLYDSSGDIEYKDNGEAMVSITADYVLHEKSSTGSWRELGKLEKYDLDIDELKKYTSSPNGWRRFYQIGEISDSYILRLDDGNNFFIVFQTVKGDTLAGYGWEDVSERDQGDSDDTYLRWLCRLESIFDDADHTGNFFERSLYASVGSDVDIFHTWMNAKNRGYRIVAFVAGDDIPTDDKKSNIDSLLTGEQNVSEKTDMGFAVFYHTKDESGYRLLSCYSYKDAALAENGVFTCPDRASLSLDGESSPASTYDVVLLNNDNIEKITRIYEYPDGKTKTVSATHLFAKEMVLFSCEEKANASRIWQYCYDEFGELVGTAKMLDGNYQRDIAMSPTNAGLYGVYDSYLFISLGGQTYRYERINTNLEQTEEYVTLEEAKDQPRTICCFKQGDIKITPVKVIDVVGQIDNGISYLRPSDRKWVVYALKEFDLSTVLVVSPAQSENENVVKFLYRNCPPKAVDPTMLNTVKEEGMVVHEDLRVTSGEDKWIEFYEKTQRGESAKIQVAHYYTLDEHNMVDVLYRAVREDYPSLYINDLTYDGSTYTITWDEYGTSYRREYKYLKKDVETIQHHSEPNKKTTVTRYLLLNDPNVTYNQIRSQMLSSQMPYNPLESYIVYTNYEKVE